MGDSGFAITHFYFLSGYSANNQQRSLRRNEKLEIVMLPPPGLPFMVSGETRKSMESVSDGVSCVQGVVKIVLPG